MRRTFGKLSLIVAIFAAMAMLTSSSAHAVPGGGGGVVNGGGSIEPGLNVLPAPQTFTFNGSVNGAFAIGTNAGTGTINCTFNGSDPNGAVAVGGPGPVSGDCTGTSTAGPVTASGNGTFLRVGAVVTVILTVTICVNSACGTGVAAAALVFTTTQTPPVTTYSVVGVVTAVVV